MAMYVNSPLKREQVNFFYKVDYDVDNVDDDNDEDVDGNDDEDDDDGNVYQLAHEARAGDLCKCRWASPTPTH